MRRIRLTPRVIIVRCAPYPTSRLGIDVYGKGFGRAKVVDLIRYYAMVPTSDFVISNVWWEQHTRFPGLTSLGNSSTRFRATTFRVTANNFRRLQRIAHLTTGQEAVARPGARRGHGFSSI